MLACENGYVYLFKALLDWGSNALYIDACDYSGETTLAMAAHIKNIKTFSSLDTELFLQYVKGNDIKAVTRFVNSSRNAYATCFKDLCVQKIANKSLVWLANANNSISHSVWLEAIYMAHCKSNEENSHNDILKLLLDDEHYMHELNEEGQTILHSAVEEYMENKCEPKGLQTIEILLNSCKCNVNALNSQKETVLHLVCSHEAHKNFLLEDLLRILLEYRVDLNLKNNFGKTALLIACENENTNIVRTLLTLTRNNDIYLDADVYDKADADETVTDNRIFGQMNLRGEKKKWRQTYSFDFKTWSEAAYVAIENSFEEILKLLLDYDAVVQRQYGSNGSTILTYCIFDKASTGKVRLKLCEKLIEFGKINVNAMNFDPTSILFGRSRDLQQLISLLLLHGINVNHKDRRGKTLVASESILSGSYVIRETLNLAKTAGTWLDIDAKDAFGRTALMTAAMWKHSDNVRMLLNAGASANLTDNRGFTAMHHALHEAMSHETWINYGSFPRNIQELNQRKATNVVLYETELNESFLGNVNELNEEKNKIVKLLLESDLDVNSLDCEGYSPMDIAVATIPEIPLHIKDALKAKGAILNVFQNENEQSEGHANLNVIVNLLHRRANLLKFCTTRRKGDYEFYMLKADKDKMAEENFSKLSANIQTQLISARDQKGRTPLHRAIISGQQISRENFIIESQVINVAQMLISLGCSVNETDIYGRTPLHYADFKKLKNLLLFHGADQTAKDENGIESIDMCKLLIAKNRRSIEDIIDKIYLCIKKPKSIYLRKGKIKTKQGNIEWNKNFNPETIPKLVWGKGTYAFRHPSVTTFREELKKFIKNLASEITKWDWRFAVDPIHIGSSFEETKIDQPDEFDINFLLKKVSQLCEVAFSPELPSGFVRLKRKHRENNNKTDKDFDSFFDNNFILTIEKLNVQFQIILRNVLSDAQFIKNHRNFDWDLDLETEGILPLYPRYELANTLKLRNMNLDLDKRNVFHISIDIVPCIHIDGWWPDEAISKVSEEIKVFGCNLVFDRPQRLHYWVPYSESCVKISFARAESEVIKRSPDAAKQAYMIAKQLIKKSKCDTSYILKNSFLYCIEALVPTFEESELRMNQNSLKSKLQQMDRQLWLKNLMKCHLDFVSRDFCPCYFMPNFSIPVGYFLKDFHMRCFTDDDYKLPDRLFRAYALYRSVSLQDSGFDFQLPPPNPVFEHFDRKAMIAKCSCEDDANDSRDPEGQNGALPQVRKRKAAAMNDFAHKKARKMTCINL